MVFGWRLNFSYLKTWENKSRTVLMARYHWMKMERICDFFVIWMNQTPTDWAIKGWNRIPKCLYECAFPEESMCESWNLSPILAPSGSIQTCTTSNWLPCSWQVMNSQSLDLLPRSQNSGDLLQQCLEAETLPRLFLPSGGSQPTTSCLHNSQSGPLLEWHKIT